VPGTVAPATIAPPVYTNLGLTPPATPVAAPISQGAPKNTGQVPATAAGPNFQAQAQATLGVAPAAPKPPAAPPDFQAQAAAKFGLKPTSIYGKPAAAPIVGGRR
jgi:hypothetical protein